MYNIKVYNKEWTTLKKTLSDLQVSSSFSIPISKGIWWGDFSFSYYWDFLISHADIIRVFSDGNMVYQWFVDWITRNINSNWDYYDITCTGMIWLLAYVRHGSVTYNDTPKNILLAIFWLVTAYTWYTFDTSWIDNIWSSIHIQMATQDSCLDAIKKVLWTVEWYFFCTDKVYFRSSWDEHIFTFQNNITSIQIAEDSRELINEYTVVYPGNSYTWSDLVSQWIYGKRKRRFDDQYVQDVGTATIRVNKELAENAYPKLNTTIRIAKIYENFWNIKPWDIAEIRNIDIWISWKKIEKVNYWLDYVDIDIDWFKDFDKTIWLLNKQS